MAASKIKGIQIRMSWRKLLLPLFLVFTASPSFSPKGDPWDERGEFLGTRRQLRQHVCTKKAREPLSRCELKSAEEREEGEWDRHLQILQRTEAKEAEKAKKEVTRKAKKAEKTGKVPKPSSCSVAKKPFTLEKPTLLSVFLRAPRVDLRLSQDYIEAIKRGEKTVDSRFDVYFRTADCDSVPTLRRLLKMEELPSDRKALVQRALDDPGSMRLARSLRLQEGDNGIKYTSLSLSLVDDETNHYLGTFHHYKILPEHTVWYVGRVESKGVLCLVTKVESFHNFEELFAKISYRRYFPNARSKEDAIRRTALFSSPEEQAMFGLRALHLEPIACGGPDHILPLSTDTQRRT